MCKLYGDVVRCTNEHSAKAPIVRFDYDRYRYSSESDLPHTAARSSQGRHTMDFLPGMDHRALSAFAVRLPSLKSARYPAAEVLKIFSAYYHPAFAFMLNWVRSSLMQPARRE
jgi:hypothetical protein